MLLFSLGQIGRLSYLSQRINGYFFEIPLIVLTLGYTVYYRRELKKAVRIHMPTVVFGLFSCVTLLVTLYRFSPIQNFVAALYLFRLLYLLWFYVVFQIAASKRPSLAKVINRSVITVIVITVFTSFVQYFFYQDLRNLYYEGWDPHLYRMFGLFFDPVFSGALYGLMALYLFFNHLYKKTLRWHYLVIFLLLTACMLFTYSRGTYLASLVVAVIFLVKTRKPLIIVPLIAVLAISLILLPKKFGEGVHLLRTSTIYARFIDSDEGIAVGMQNPLFGVGYNHIRAVKKFADEVSANGYSYSHAGASFHSSYVTILASEGIIGLILFAWMLLSWSRRSEYANYAITFIGILSLTDNVFLYPFVLVFLIITICSNTRDAGRYL